VVVALVLGLFLSGTFDDFTLERTAQLVRSYGPWGIAVAFTFLQPLGMSGTVFAVVAGWCGLRWAQQPGGALPHVWRREARLR
jgi:membrane protein YqaA with SNARE-associated domain